MIQYIYFVKCPHCEDEPFDFFDEAKAYAASCLAKKPIITQVEVDRNDFGECVGSSDLGPIWSWEEMMGAQPEPEVTFCKADLESDAEFDALDNSLAPQCVAAPAPTLSIDQLVEMIEENEDTVECKWCNELFDKSECRFEVDMGWLCHQCIAAIESRGETLTFREGPLEENLSIGDYTIELEYENLTATVVTKVIPATWEEPSDYEEGEFTGPYTYEVDAEKVAEVLLTHFMIDEDFADLPGGKADLEDGDTFEKFFDEHLDDLVDKYYEQLLAHFEDSAAEEASHSEKFQDSYADAMQAAEDDYWDRRYEEQRDARLFDESKITGVPNLLEELEDGDAYRERLSDCPECGDKSFDPETGICINCGFVQLNAGELTEDFSGYTITCPNCNHRVIPTNDLVCPNCEASDSLLDYVVDQVEDSNSKYILFFNDNGTIGKSDGNYTNPTGPNYEIIGITKAYFDYLPATKHDDTLENSTSGGLTLDDVTDFDRKVLKALRARSHNYNKNL